MSDLGDVLELLHTSTAHWRSLRLQGHEWRHSETFRRAWEHEVGNVGNVPGQWRPLQPRSRFHLSFKRRGVTRVELRPITPVASLAAGKEPDESSEEWRLWLAKPNKIRTQFRVGTENVTAVFIGKRWWSWTTLGYKTNEGDVNVGHGLGPAEVLMNPGPHLGSLQLRVDDRSTFLSRPVYLVTAIPLVADPRNFNLTVHMLGMGADVYKMVVDAELGILLRTQAEFEGVAFRVIEIDELAANEKLGESLFDPKALRHEGLE